MDKKLSLEDYDTLYKSALLARDEMHLTVPKTIESLEEYQRICRVCGCQDDGNLVELDKKQDFDFEPSICNYRMLFQRTSLQFQFHSMPDLPGCICAMCAYKVKIFYLLTRQFVIGQQMMRNVVTDFYRDSYAIEPPEQLEDRLLLHKQLALLAKSKPQPSKAGTKELTKVSQSTKRVSSKLQRSTSADSSLNAGGKATTELGPIQASEVTIRQMNLIGCQLSQSTVNLRQRTNKSPSPKKKQLILPPATTAAPRAQRKERNPTAKVTRNVQCIVTPRVENFSSREEVLLAKNQTAFPNTQVAAAVSGINGSLTQRSIMPPSKAQLQKLFQDRRKQWR